MQTFQSKSLALLTASVVGAATLAASSAQATPTWAQTFGVDPGTVGADFQGDYPRSIVRMPDGGAVVGGYIFVPGSAVQNNVTYNGIFGESALVRYAADGTIVWKAILGPSALNLTVPTSMVADAAGNIYVACGRPRNPADSNAGAIPYVAKLSPSGVLLWATNVKLPGPPDPNQGNATPYLNDFARSIILTSDGKVAVGGSYNPGGGGGHATPYLVELSTDGQVLGAQYFENPHVQYSDAQAMAAGPNGKILFVTRSGVAGANYGNTFVLVDKDGHIVVERAYTSGTFIELPAAINGTSDGGFIEVSPVGRFGAATIIRKLNADLTRQWEKVIHVDNRTYYGTSVEETADGGYLIGARGGSASNPNGEKALLTKLDANGGVEKIFAIGSDGFGETGSPLVTLPVYPCVATVTTDGGYAIAGPDASDWWIAKTDLTGKVRNYKGFMKDVTAEFKEDANTQDIIDTTDFVEVAATTENTGSPQLVISDPSAALVSIQASSPRIMSLRNAEAIVGQHFSYEVVGGFFAGPINYSVQGLPSGFAFDSHTGIISCVPAAGTETEPEKPGVPPILITLHATDGTDTADAILTLRIGDGTPAFTVNGSAFPSPSLADTVLTFASKQPGDLAGRIMTVQARTPNTGTAWITIDDDTHGFMTYAAKDQAYVLGSTNYPHLGGVSFRARLAAPGHPDVFSNEVGPFDLSSSTNHLRSPALYVTKNGPVANIRFGATELTIPSGVELHVQATRTPADEASWVNAPVGTSGKMEPDTNTPAPNEFYLGSDSYPISEDVYFRAVATASPSIQAISTVHGPFTFIDDPAPVVTITLPQGATGGDIDHPILVSTQTFKVQVNATSGRALKRLLLIYDQDVLQDFTGGVTSGSLDYITTVPGEHLIEALATDDLGVVGDAVPVRVRIAPAAPGRMFLATTQSGNWNDSGNWVDTQGNHGVPGANDFAVLGSFSPSLVTDVTVNSLSLNGGTISGPGKLTVTGFCTISGGRLTNEVTIAQGATCELINDDDIGLSGTLINNGRLKVHGRGGITGVPNTGSVARGAVINPDGFFDGVLGAVKNFGQWLFGRPAGGRNGNGSAHPPAKPLPAPEVRNIGLETALNGGVVKAGDAGSLITNDGGTLITNDGGTLITNDGGTLITNDGGTLVATGGGNAVAKGAANLIDLSQLHPKDGAIAGVVSNDSAGLVATGGGNMINKAAANINLGPQAGARSSTEAAATSPALYQQTGGETDLSQITIIGSVSLDGGILDGKGSILGSLTNNGGYLSAGHSPGMIAVTESYTQGSGGTMIVETTGGLPSQFDQLQIGGNASLGGKLDVRLINGYIPLPNDPFVPVGSSSVSGSFASASSNIQLTQTSTGIVVTIDPAKPNPLTGQPLNISTRMRVLTDDKVLIGGFIVTGPSGSTKKVLIRGMGPTLGDYGIGGVLSDPFLKLSLPDGSSITNDDWAQAPNKDQIPSGFAPKAKESVIIADLAPGAYTVIESGAHSETGIGLTEVYDISSGSAAQLANISTRGFVDTNDNVMIGGFIIGGSEPAQILVRATGPTLKNYGLTGTLDNPTLELTDANGNAIDNDDWRATQEQEIIATTVQPSDNKEPAILATLVPGAYTAIVRGKNNTTGIAIVEAYKIK